MTSYRCNAVSIVVSDMARALEFYRLCGFELPETPDEGHVEVTVGDGFRIMWDTEDVVRTFDPGWVRPTGGHRAALAVECDDPALVDDLHARVVAAGFDSHLEPFDAFWGQRYAVVHDPDGTPVDLYARLA